MNNLLIKKTDLTPEIDFNINGDLKICGRSLPEDAHKFYNPIIEWIKNLECEKITLELKLEYINTSSTKKFLYILIALDRNAKVGDVEVNWHFETDDIEMEDLGTIYQKDLKRTKFNYIEGTDIF